MQDQTTSTAPTAAVEDSDKLYGEDYYANYWGGGGPYERNDRWLAFFGAVADGLIRDFHPATVLDAGCALGFLVEQLRRKGVDASGFDISEFAISQVDESVAAHCKVASLTDPIAGRYDLITCIEVLEHLPPDQADAAIANLCSATDRVVMSSTPGDYGEPTHLNVLQPEEWAVKFAQNGFVRDLDRDLSYLSRWTAVYVRREELQVETVRRYDRAWWRLRREVGEVRESLLVTQAALDAERDADKPRDPDAETKLERQGREITQLNNELLRARDQLIGKDQEMGVIKGRLTVAEDRVQRLMAVRERITTRVPGLRSISRLAMKLLRGRG